MEDLVTNSRFWMGRRVFVTGHTGFKGSWLVLWLKALGAEVAGYALAPATEPSLFAVAHLADRIYSVEGDLADINYLAAAIEAQQPEVVFHLAAQSLVRRSYEDPVGTFATNLMGTVHLLDAVRRTPSVRSVVVATSDKCYENREWAWCYRENDPMGGYDPYSASKGCAELAVAAYRRSFFARNDAVARIATVRAGNVIGGGDWAVDRLVPDVVTALVRGEPIQVRFPRAVRPWQNVLDALNGYLMLAERMLRADGARFGESWNFGPAPEDACPVEELVGRICQLWGVGPAWNVEGATEPHEATTLMLDSGLARSRLGWRPALSLDESLAWLVEWYRAWYIGPGDMVAVTLSQIERFQERIRANAGA